jgi:hypothetical protein
LCEAQVIVTAQVKANRREAWLDILTVFEAPAWQFAKVRALAHYLAAELILTRGLRVSISVELLACGARVIIGDNIGTDTFTGVLELDGIAKRFASLGVQWLPPIANTYR